jgi:hypothetical protein
MLKYRVVVEQWLAEVSPLKCAKTPQYHGTANFAANGNKLLMKTTTGRQNGPRPLPASHLLAGWIVGMTKQQGTQNEQRGEKGNQRTGHTKQQGGKRNNGEQ